MFDRAKFFTTFRAKSGDKLTSDQVRGIEAILDACIGLPLAWASYAFATAWHETNAKMLPVREAYWLSEDWRKRNLRYYPHYGRGYVQITWPENYAKADEELTILGYIKPGELINNLDRALEPFIAAEIMRLGMEDGWFAKTADGKVHNFARHLPESGTATRTEYMNARRIINGTDKADLIEDYAQWFERSLRDGNW